MNILVTGANGQLGNEMQIVARDGEDHYFFTDVCDGYERLDITDLEAVRTFVKDNAIDCIVNCAAWTNVDAAEDPDKYAIVEKLNAEAPENLAKAMKEAGGMLIHISTDYVFGGDPYNTPCNEEQKGTPTGVYGLTKLHGEQAIQRVFKNNSMPPMGEQTRPAAYVIIRTAWLYSEFGKNFVKTMLNLTATKPQLKVVIDQAGTPTYALDLAKAILKIISQYKSDIKNEDSPTTTPPSGDWEAEPLWPYSGIYHYSNEGVCSWYDFTKEIAEMSGQSACDIQPCTSTEFPSPVKRPSYSVLDKTKIKQTFGVEVPYWTESLKVCIDKIRVSPQPPEGEASKRV